MKLVETKEIDKPVRIHNDIASGKGDFSACMLDILFYILSDFKKGEQEYLIRAKNIAELTGREWNYRQFRDATSELGSRMFEIETENESIQLWLFGSVTYLKGEGSFIVELSKRSLPYLEDLKNNFTSVQLKSILFCNSKYAKRIYMLGCKWRGAGKVPLMTISDFKIMLGLKDPKGNKKEQYTRWSAFKSDVLDIAMKQVNEHTDIMISYNLIKLGRSYNWIEILINHKASNQLQISFDKTIKEQGEAIPMKGQKATESIVRYGFTENQAIAIAKYGIKAFEEIRDKLMPKIQSGDMTGEGFVNYIVSVYKKKKVL